MRAAGTLGWSFESWGALADFVNKLQPAPAVEQLPPPEPEPRVELAPGVVLYNADCREILPTLQGLHACVTDPPYHLTSSAGSSKGFMGKEWDGGDISFQPDTWKAVWAALLPGSHLVAFSGTRTYHRIACAIDAAGFEIRNMQGWLFGSGFPKDKNQLKPAFEPACLARRPLDRKTVAQNILAHGTGGLNIDACRIEAEIGANLNGGRVSTKTEGWDRPWKHDPKSLAACKQRGIENVAKAEALGRWPANLCHDGSDEVLALFPDSKSGGGNAPGKATDTVYAGYKVGRSKVRPLDGEGSAARFFYCAKVSPKERGDSKHPTMKPIALMEWLCKLVAPPGGQIVDPFMGSGSTGVAAVRNGFKFVGIERDPEHFVTAVARIKAELDKK